jgi:hypothetical protein
MENDVVGIETPPQIHDVAVWIAAQPSEVASLVVYE